MSALNALSAESYRLAALHSLGALDSDETPELVGLCQSAATTCGAPMAWLALIDAKRRWLKASWGWQGSVCEPRSGTACERVVVSAAPVVVSKPGADPQMPQAYIGMPLVLPGGEVVGALAVLHDRPLDPEPAQLATLQSIAAQAVAQLVSGARQFDHSDGFPVDSADRAAEFLRHANQVLLAEGYGDFSVRKVAKAAEVGVGHLQHYFPTKQALLEAMIDALSATLWQHYAAHIAPVKNPLDRLLACAVFVLDEGKRYDRARLLREYTVMAQHEPKVAMTLAAYFSRSRTTVTELLQELHTELSPALAAARAAEIVSLLSSAFLFTQSVDVSGRLPGYDDYLKARMVELAHFPPFLAS
ncbi:MAG: TetR/AcrR family transcriptional regulator [Pseudomonadales bacterium]